MSDVDVIIRVHTEGVQQIGNLSASLRNLNNSMRGIITPMSKLDSHSRAVYKALGITSRGVDQHAKSIKGLIQNQKALGAETKNISRDLNSLKNAYALAGREATALGRSLGITTREMQSFSRTFRMMRLRALGSDLHNISLRLSKIGKDAQFVGRSLMINLTLPLATFARIGLSNFLAVEKQMVRITKVMEDMAPTMDIAAQKIVTLTDTMKNQGRSLDDINSKDLVTAEQIQQAQRMVDNFNKMDSSLTQMSLKFGVSKDIISSVAADFGELGLTVGENVQALTNLTLEIEQLGTMDIGPAQDLTQALYFQSRRALELNGQLKNVTSAREREKKAIDASITQMYLFNAIENATALTLRDLGDSFAEVSAMATSYGLSMTEAAAMLAPMKAAGLDIGASANSIKVSLQRLLAPTKQNVETLKKLAAEYGVAENKQNEFLLSTKTGLTGLSAVVKVFDRVRDSKQGAEGALRLMSDLFEKRQGPRMYLAIEQLSNFNKELQQTELYLGKTLPKSASAEVQLARVADEAGKKFENFNTTIVPKTIRSFGDIGVVARIATAAAGQKIEIEPGKEVAIKEVDIRNAKAMRQAVSDLVLVKKQAEGIDIISEVKDEAGRAMMIQLAGAANAKQVAEMELSRSLKSANTEVERIKNTFKLFAADIIRDLIPTIKKISQKVVEMYEKFKSPEFAETRATIVKLIIAFGSFLAFLGPVILAIGTFQSVVGKVGLAVTKFIPKLKNADGGLTMLGKSAEFAKKEMNSLYETFLRTTGAARASRAGSSGLTPVPPPLPPTPPPPLIPGTKKGTFLTPTDARSVGTVAERTGAVQKARLAKAGLEDITGGPTAAEQQAAFQRYLRRHPGATRLPPAHLAAGYGIPFAPTAETRAAFDTYRGLTPKQRSDLTPTSSRKAARRQVDAAKKFALRQPFYEKAGVGVFQEMTETGTVGRERFAFKGRKITQGQAQRLALGGPGSIVARAQIAGSRLTAPVRSVGRAVTAARTAAAAAPSTGAGLVAATRSMAVSAGAGIGGIVKTTGAWQAASAALAAYNAKLAAFNKTEATGFKKYSILITSFIKNMKLATIATRIFRTALLFTGIGAVIAGIAAVVFLVIKNMDKIKGTKKAWDALKRAFNLIKEAAMEIVRPIQDLFAQFGGGSNDAEKAGNGIANVFTKIASVIEYVAGLIKILVEKVIKPYLYGIVNVIMAVVQLFKGNWKDALKFLIAAVSQVAIGVISLWQMLGKALITVSVGFIKLIVTIFIKGIVNGLAQAIIVGLRGIVNLIGFIPFADKVTDPINNALKGVGGFVNDMTSKAANGINSVLGGIEGFAKKSVDVVGDKLKEGLKKGAELGIKESSNKIRNDKKVPKAAEDAGDLAGEAISDAYGDAPIEDANKKIAGKIKEGIQDAVQRLQDYIAGRFASSLKKFISDSVKALNKQKEAALKVFDIQLNTLMKLEKAEESLTKKKEYETNRRKLIDDAVLRGEVYRRNRALAIYEGRIDDARIMDLEEQRASKESDAEIANLDESRRKDLAKENLEALKEAINNAKDLAGKFFEESIEKFQEAAEHITRIAPVTLEQYTQQLNELQTLTIKAGDQNNLEFGKMFEKFSTTIAEKMPNAVDDFGKALGAFITPLDELVNLAMEKYGLGSEDEASVLGVTRQMADAVIGITLGMLVDIGDTFVGESSNITEKFGNITGGIVGDIETFKTEALANFTTLLEETKTAFLTPYKKALDEAEPAKVFKNAIIDGNAEILRSFQNMVDLNPGLMSQLAASLDPAINKYIELKAKIDAAKEAAASGFGDGSGGGKGGGSGSGKGGGSGVGSGVGSAFNDRYTMPKGIDPYDQAERRRFESLRLGLQKPFDEAQMRRLAPVRALAIANAKRDNPSLVNFGYTDDQIIDLMGAKNLTAIQGKPFIGPMPPSTVRPNTGSGGGARLGGFWNQVNKIGAQDGLIDKLTRFDQSTLDMISGGVKRVDNVIAKINEAIGVNALNDVLGFKEGGPITDAAMLRSTPYGISGFLNAPETQGIPAILHGGEFVINADAVKRVGIGALAKLNDPRIPKFKKGGLVGKIGTEDQIAISKSLNKKSLTNDRYTMPKGVKTLGYTADTLERLIVAPTLNLNKQPIIRNKDGSIARGTANSVLVDMGDKTGRVMVAPTFDHLTKSNLGGQEAVNRAVATGHNFGIYPNQRIASLAANNIAAQEFKKIAPVIIKDNYKTFGSQVIRQAEAVDTSIKNYKDYKKAELAIKELRQDAAGRKFLSSQIPGRPKDPSKFENVGIVSTPLEKVFKGLGNTVMGTLRFAKGNITGDRAYTERGAGQILSGLGTALNPVNLIPAIPQLASEILMGFGRTGSLKNAVWGKNAYLKVIGSLVGLGKGPTMDEVKMAGLGLFEDISNIATIFTLGGSVAAKTAARRSVLQLIKAGEEKVGDKFLIMTLQEQIARGAIRPETARVLVPSLKQTGRQVTTGALGQEFAVSMANQTIKESLIEGATSNLLSGMLAQPAVIRQGFLNLAAKVTGKETPRKALPSLLAFYKTRKAMKVDPDAFAEMLIRNASSYLKPQTAIGPGTKAFRPTPIIGALGPGTTEAVIPSISPSPIPAAERIIAKIPPVSGRPDFKTLKEVLALPPGDLTGRNLPVSLYKENLYNPITVRSGGVIDRGRYDVEDLKKSGTWVKGWMEDLSLVQNVTQKGFLLEGQYFKGLPGLLGNTPVGFGFNLGSPQAVKRVFSTLPEDISLIQAQPFEILDTALGYMHGGGGIATRDFFNSPSGAQFKGSFITDRFSPSQVKEKAYSFVYDYAHAQGAPSSIEQYLKSYERWTEKLERDLLFYKENPKFGEKTVDDIWKDFTRYNDLLDGLSLSEYEDFIKQIPIFGKDLTEAQIDYIALNAANGNAEAKFMFDQLSDFGKKVRKLIQDSQRRQSYKYLDIDERLNLDNLLWIREEVGEFPMFQIQSDGSLNLFSRSQLSYDDPRGALDRNTIHGAINHIVKGGTFGGRANIPGANLIAAKVKDILAYNPGSFNTLLGIDSAIVAPPFGSIRLPAGKYELAREGWEVFSTYPPIRDPYIDSIYRHIYAKQHSMNVKEVVERQQDVLKERMEAFASASKLRQEIEELIVQDSFYKASISPMSMDYLTYEPAANNATLLDQKRTEMDKILYEAEKKYIKEVRAGLFGQYMINMDKAEKYFEQLLPGITGKVADDFSGMEFNILINKLHPEMFNRFIATTPTRSLFEERLFGRPEFGGLGFPKISKTGQQEMDPAASRALARIGLDLPDPVIPSFHPYQAAIFGQYELPTGTFERTGVHSIQSLTQIGRNAILRGYSSDATWIQEFLGYFPGKYTRLKVIAQEPWENIIAATRGYNITDEIFNLQMRQIQRKELLPVEKIQEKLKPLKAIPTPTGSNFIPQEGPFGPKFFRSPIDDVSMTPFEARLPGFTEQLAMLQGLKRIAGRHTGSGRKNVTRQQFLRELAGRNIVDGYIVALNKALNLRMIERSGDQVAFEAYLKRLALYMSQGMVYKAAPGILPTPLFPESVANRGAVHRFTLDRLLNLQKEKARTDFMIDLFNKFIYDHASITPEDIVTYRGLGIALGDQDPLEYFNHLYVNNNMPPHFISTSINEHIARSFMGTRNTAGVLEKLIIPKGTGVFVPEAYNMGLQAEREIIIPPEYKVKYTDIQQRPLDYPDAHGALGHYYEVIGKVVKAQPKPPPNIAYIRDAMNIDGGPFVPPGFDPLDLKTPLGRIQMKLETGMGRINRPQALPKPFEEDIFGPLPVNLGLTFPKEMTEGAYGLLPDSGIFSFLKNEENLAGLALGVKREFDRLTNFMPIRNAYEEVASMYELSPRMVQRLINEISGRSYLDEPFVVPPQLAGVENPNIFRTRRLSKPISSTAYMSDTFDEGQVAFDEIQIGTPPLPPLKNAINIVKQSIINKIAAAKNFITRFTSRSRRGIDIIENRAARGLVGGNIKADYTYPKSMYDKFGELIVSRSRLSTGAAKSPGDDDGLKNVLFTGTARARKYVEQYNLPTYLAELFTTKELKQINTVLQNIKSGNSEMIRTYWSNMLTRSYSGDSDIAMFLAAANAEKMIGFSFAKDGSINLGDSLALAKLKLMSPLSGGVADKAHEAAIKEAMEAIVKADPRYVALIDSLYSVDTPADALGSYRSRAAAAGILNLNPAGIGYTPTTVRGKTFGLNVERIFERAKSKVDIGPPEFFVGPDLPAVEYAERAPYYNPATGMEVFLPSSIRSGGQPYEPRQLVAIFEQEYRKAYGRMLGLDTSFSPEFENYAFLSGDFFGRESFSTRLSSMYERNAKFLIGRTLMDLPDDLQNTLRLTQNRISLLGENDLTGSDILFRNYDEPFLLNNTLQDIFEYGQLPDAINNQVSKIISSFYDNSGQITAYGQDRIEQLTRYFEYINDKFNEFNMTPNLDLEDNMTDLEEFIAAIFGPVGTDTSFDSLGVTAGRGRIAQPPHGLEDSTIREQSFSIFGALSGNRVGMAPYTLLDTTIDSFKGLNSIEADTIFKLISGDPNLWKHMPNGGLAKQRYLKAATVVQELISGRTPRDKILLPNQPLYDLSPSLHITTSLLGSADTRAAAEGLRSALHRQFFPVEEYGRYPLDYAMGLYKGIERLGNPADILVALQDSNFFLPFLGDAYYQALSEQYYQMLTRVAAGTGPLVDNPDAVLGGLLTETSAINDIFAEFFNPNITELELNTMLRSLTQMVGLPEDASKALLSRNVQIPLSHAVNTQGTQLELAQNMRNLTGRVYNLDYLSSLEDPARGSRLHFAFPYVQDFHDLTRNALTRYGSLPRLPSVQRRTQLRGVTEPFDPGLPIRGINSKDGMNLLEQILKPSTVNTRILPLHSIEALVEKRALEVDFPEILIGPDGTLMPTFTQFEGHGRQLYSEFSNAIAELMPFILNNGGSALSAIPAGISRYYDNLVPSAQNLILQLIRRQDISPTSIIDSLIPDVAPDYIGYMTPDVPIAGGYQELRTASPFPPSIYPRLRSNLSYPIVPQQLPRTSARRGVAMIGVDPIIDQPYGHFAVYGGRGQPLFEGLPPNLKAELQSAFYRNLNEHLHRLQMADRRRSPLLTIPNQVVVHQEFYDAINHYIRDMRWWRDLDDNLKSRVITEVYSSGGVPNRRAFAVYPESPIPELQVAPQHHYNTPATPALIRSDDDQIARIIEREAEGGNLGAGINVAARFRGYGYRGTTTYGRGDMHYLSRLGTVDEAMRVMYGFGPGVYPPTGVPYINPAGEVSGRLAVRGFPTPFSFLDPQVRAMVPPRVPLTPELIPGLPDPLERIALNIPHRPGDLDSIQIDEAINRLRFTIFDRQGIPTEPIDYSSFSQLYTPPQLVPPVTASPPLQHLLHTPIITSNEINMVDFISRLRENPLFAPHGIAGSPGRPSSGFDIGDPGFKQLTFPVESQDMMEAIIKSIFGDTRHYQKQLVDALFQKDIVQFQNVLRGIVSGSFDGGFNVIPDFSTMLDSVGYGLLNPDAAKRILQQIVDNPQELFQLLSRRAGLGPGGISLTALPSRNVDIVRGIIQQNPNSLYRENISGNLMTYRHNPIYGYQAGADHSEILNLQSVLSGSGTRTSPVLNHLMQALSELKLIYPQSDDLASYFIDAEVARKVIELPFIAKSGRFNVFDPSGRGGGMGDTATVRNLKLYEGVVNIMQNAIRGMIDTRDGAAIMKALIQSHTGSVDELFIPTLASSMDVLLGVAGREQGFNATPAMSGGTRLSIGESLEMALRAFGSTHPDTTLLAEFISALHAQLTKSRLLHISSLSGLFSSPPYQERIFLDALIDAMKNNPSQLENLGAPRLLDMEFALSAPEFKALHFGSTQVGFETYLGSGLMSSIGESRPFLTSFEGRSGAEILTNLARISIRGSTMQSPAGVSPYNRLKLFYQMYRDYIQAGKNESAFIGRAAQSLAEYGSRPTTNVAFRILPPSNQLPSQLKEMFDLFEMAETIARQNPNIPPGDKPLLSKIHASYMDEIGVQSASYAALHKQILPYLDSINVIGSESGAVSHYAQRMSYSLGLPVLPFGHTNINPYDFSLAGHIRSPQDLVRVNLSSNMLSPVDITELNLYKMLRDKLHEENISQIGLPITPRTSIGLPGKNLSEQYIRLLNPADRTIRQREGGRLAALALFGAGAGAGLAAGGAAFFSQGDKASALSNLQNTNPINADRLEEKIARYYSAIDSLKEFIASGESINALDPYSAWAKPGAPGLIMPNMTSMKIGEIINASGGHAVGKYQNMPQYLLQRAQVAGFNRGTVFNKDVQEAIMLSTLMSSPQDGGIGLISLLNKRIGINTAVDRIANMWRSMSGTDGKFVGGGRNPTGKDLSRKDLVIKNLLEQIMMNYPGFKKGGYVKGAASKAIPATLHGGEYVLNAKAVSALGIPTLNALNMINPSNKKPDPDPDHPSRRRKIPKSPEVKGHEEREALRKRLQEGPLPPRPTLHMYPPYGFDPERDVKQPGPDEKNDARRFPGANRRIGRPIIPMPQPPQKPGNPQWNMQIPNLAMGGMRFSPPITRTSTVQAPVTNNMSTVNIQVENFIGQEEWFNSMMKEYNVNVLPKNQKLAGLQQRKFTSYNGINQGM